MNAVKDERAPTFRNLFERVLVELRAAHKRPWATSKLQRERRHKTAAEVHKKAFALAGKAGFAGADRTRLLTRALAPAIERDSAVAVAIENFLDVVDNMEAAEGTKGKKAANEEWDRAFQAVLDTKAKHHFELAAKLAYAADYAMLIGYDRELEPAERLLLSAIEDAVDMVERRN